MSGDKDAKIDQARQLAESGKFSLAISVWRQLLEETPHNDATIYNTIGDLCLKKKDTGEALDAYGHGARCYLQEGFHLKAIALYRKILKLDPNRADVYALLGDLNVVRGLTNNAVADYLVGAKTYVQSGKPLYALTLLRKIVKVDPQNMAVHLRVAELCLQEKLTDQALEEYLSMGQKYQRLGQVDEAGKLYKQILAIAPGHQEARRRLENVQAPVVEEREAREARKESMRVDIDAGAVMLAMPMEPVPVPTESDRVHVFEIERTLVVEPPESVPIGAFGSATVKFQIEGLEWEAPASAVAAVGHAEAVGHADVVVAPAEEEVTPGEVSDVPVEVGSTQGMAAEWEAFLAPSGHGDHAHADAQASDTHYEMGVAYKEMGLLNDAMEEFQLAMRGPTRFVDAGVMLAACYRAQDRPSSAMAVLTRVLADTRCEGPGVPYVTYDLALLYEDEGRTDHAVPLYEAILGIRDAEARLQRLQGSEEPIACPPIGIRRPVVYL